MRERARERERERRDDKQDESNKVVCGRGRDRESGELANEIHAVRGCYRERMPGNEREEYGSDNRRERVREKKERKN